MVKIADRIVYIYGSGPLRRRINPSRDHREMLFTVDRRGYLSLYPLC